MSGQHKHYSAYKKKALTQLNHNIHEPLALRRLWSDTKQASPARNESQSVYKVNSSEEYGFCLLGYSEVLSLCSSGLKKKTADNSLDKDVCKKST